MLSKYVNDNYTVVKLDENNSLPLSSSLRFLDIKQTDSGLIQMGSSKFRLSDDKLTLLPVESSELFGIKKEGDNLTQPIVFSSTDGIELRLTNLSQNAENCSPLALSSKYVYCYNMSQKIPVMDIPTDHFEFWALDREGQISEYRDLVVDLDVDQDQVYILKQKGEDGGWVLEILPTSDK